MLGYLDALISALSLRDTPETERLLVHPLARLLPATVRDEAHGFVSGARDPLAVPMCALQLRRQTAELLQEIPVVADAPEPIVSGPRPAGPPRHPSRVRPQQIELPLSA